MDRPGKGLLTLYRPNHPSLQPISKNEIKQRLTRPQTVQKPQPHLLEQPDLAFLHLLSEEQNM